MDCTTAVLPLLLNATAKSRLPIPSRSRDGEDRPLRNAPAGPDKAGHLPRCSTKSGLYVPAEERKSIRAMALRTD
jgi:hypothetical protein